jgi:hypothetical protein
MLLNEILAIYSIGIHCEFLAGIVCDAVKHHPVWKSEKCHFIK